jgi:cysteine desulfurase family protein
MIYLDNAATSWPKPPEVLRGMTDALERSGGNPGRSGHRLSIEAARLIYDTRELLADFFNSGDPLGVIFAGNATHALNLAIYGLLRPGDRVVTTSMEHNSVMRPLRHLERKGVEVCIVPCARDGTVDPAQIAQVVTPGTRLVVSVYASNVVGTIMPVKEIAAIAHGAGALLLVDAAQAAGALPIDMQDAGIDLLAFTGHKALLGSPGIGGLVIRAGVDASQIEPLMRGGTGSQSEIEEHPDFLPDRFESGTPNLVGIASLKAGIEWLKEKGLDAVREHEKDLTRRLIEGLSDIPGLHVYGTLDAEKCVAIVSFTAEKKTVSEIGMRLDEEYGVLVRVGLHCAPAAHKTIGSFPEGTVRLAPGIFTTHTEVDIAVKAVAEVVKT